jgi:hypothetical protein
MPNMIQVFQTNEDGQSASIKNPTTTSITPKNIISILNGAIRASND